MNTPLGKLRLNRAGYWMAVSSVLALLAACNDHPRPEVIEGNPEEGRKLIILAGCGSCHQIPGINSAQGQVGPPLRDLVARGYLAGILPNNIDNLVLWIANPQSIAPGSAMPDTGVTPAQAKDIAAYLYTMDEQ